MFIQLIGELIGLEEKKGNSTPFFCVVRCQGD